MLSIINIGSAIKDSSISNMKGCNDGIIYDKNLQMVPLG
jgi:hypothetical protein